MTEDNNQMLSAISELLDRKLSSELQPIKHDLAGLKQEFGGMKQDKRIDVLEQYYRIKKADDENMSVVLKLVLDLKEDVDVLKAKIP